MSNASPRGSEFLLKHVGHEVKYLVFAVAEFRKTETERFHVPLQDSVLVRARALIEFFMHSGSKNVYITGFYDPPGSHHPPSPVNAQKWFDFISGRLSHVGRNRDDDAHDQWPDRKSGEDKGNDRLDRLAIVILKLIRSRLDAVRSDCRPVLEQIANRAEEYLDDPSDDRFHAMDPSNIGAHLGIVLTESIG